MIPELKYPPGVYSSTGSPSFRDGSTSVGAKMNSPGPPPGLGTISTTSFKSRANVTVCGSSPLPFILHVTVSPARISTVRGKNSLSELVPSAPPTRTDKFRGANSVGCSSTDCPHATAASAASSTINDGACLIPSHPIVSVRHIQSTGIRRSESSSSAFAILRRSTS